MLDCRSGHWLAKGPTLALTLAMAMCGLHPTPETRLGASVQAQMPAPQPKPKPKPKPVRIHVVDYPRPVAAAVRQIEQQFGRIVTYEDTSYVYAGDVVDVTEQVRRDGDMSKRVFGMRSGSIDFTHTPRRGPIDGQVEEVLQEVLTRSTAAGNTGAFRILSVRGGHHVVPAARTGVNGLTEPDASPLETRITVPHREATGLEVMRLLAETITAHTGRPVTPGLMPINRLLQTHVAVEARNETARDVLWRVLQSIGPNLSWQLLCEVGEQGMCAINIHFVRPASVAGSSPAGRAKLRAGKSLAIVPDRP